MRIFLALLCLVPALVFAVPPPPIQYNSATTNKDIQAGTNMVIYRNGTALTFSGKTDSNVVNSLINQAGLWTNDPTVPSIYPADSGGPVAPATTTNRVEFISSTKAVKNDNDTKLIYSEGGTSALNAGLASYIGSDLTNGQSAGLLGEGISGLFVNYGVIGLCEPKFFSGGTNVGVAGMSVPFGSDGVYVGGFFGVAADSSMDPKYENSVILGDNMNQGGPLLTLRTNNGTIMFQVTGGGDVINNFGRYIGNGIGLTNIHLASLQQDSATSGQAVTWNGSTWVPAAPTAAVTNFTIYASGTAYTLTGSSAALDFGTTDPILTINQAGTYLIQGNVGVLYSGATYVGAQTITLKFRRTNNTAADLSNGSRAVELPVLTTFTGGDVMTLPPVVYTATSGDTITIFGILSATPAAGSVQATSAEIVAIRLY